jgi:hypothetical protein
MTFGTPTKNEMEEDQEQTYTVSQGAGNPDWVFTLSGLTDRIARLTTKGNAFGTSDPAKRDRYLVRASEFTTLKNDADKI